MWLFVPNNLVLANYANELMYLFGVLWWFHVYDGLYFLFIRRIPVRVTHKPKYSISICPKNEFLILHLSLLSLIFCWVSSNFSKRMEQPPLVIINRSSNYAWINSNLRIISFIFSWKIPGELFTPIGGC